VEEEQKQSGDPQKTSENIVQGASVSKNKVRRKMRTGIPKNLPFSSCPVSFDFIDGEERRGAAFIFVCPIPTSKSIVVEGSLHHIEERPERLLPQRRQGSKNHSPLPNRPSTAK
jgi:hypothetical protein